MAAPKPRHPAGAQFRISIEENNNLILSLVWSGHQQGVEVKGGPQLDYSGAGPIAGPLTGPLTSVL